MNNKQFYIESWNHSCFGSENYAVLYGPFPISFRREITEELKRNLKENVKFVSYIAE